MKKIVNDEEDYWRSRELKLIDQMEKPMTQLFKNCVFYILGFVGRGSESRLSLSKTIERNGGRATLAITGQVTHVVATNLCHSKKKQLFKAINKRKMVIVNPEYVFECVKQGKMIDPTQYLSVKQDSCLITEFLES